MTEKSQVPAFSIEAEMSTLGSMILSQKVAEQLSKEMEADDFFRPAHQTIFTAICHVIKTMQINLVTLRTELLSRGVLGDVGGMDYIMQLAEYVPGGSNANHFSEIVKDRKFIRDSVKAAQDLQLVSLSSDVEHNAGRMDAWEKSIADVRKSFVRIGKEPKSLNAVFKDMDAGICKAFEGEGPKAFKTGFPSLDRVFRGFFPGRQYFLGGYSKDGKTAMLCELIFKSAKLAYEKEYSIEKNMAEVEKRQFDPSKVIGAPWVVFTGEMSERELLARFIQSRTGIDSNDILLGEINGEQYQEIGDVMEEFHRLPIHVVERLGTIEDIHRECMKISQKYGRLAGFGVDYIQLMTSAFKRDGVREFDALMYGFKEIAKELNCSSLLLSQLNRDSKKSEGPPVMEQMKGSGGIEASADVVMMLHRPNRGENVSRENATCYVRKNRFGPEGFASLHFVPSRVLWKETNESL